MWETKNVDEIEDTQWMYLIGKPVTLGVYLQVDDAQEFNTVGVLVRIYRDGEKFKALFTGDREVWFNTEAAYGLITYEVSP